MMDLDRFNAACIDYDMQIMMKLLPQDSCIDYVPFRNDQLKDVIEKRMTEKERTAISLRFNSDRQWTYKEIAEEMGVSVTRARQLVMSSINKVLNADGEEWTNF